MAPLPVRIEECALEPLQADVSSDFQRKTTLIRLRGDGAEGIGEDVTYDALEQKTEACASWKEAADIYEAIGAGDSLDEVKQARADAGCS